MRCLSALIAVIALTALSLSSVQVASASPSFELPGERFSWSQMAPKRGSKEGYGEKYTFDATLKGPNGEAGSLYLSLMIANLGPGDHKMTSRGSVTYNGVKVKWSQKLKAKRWKSKAQPLSIQAGQVTLSEESGALILSLNHPKLAFKLAVSELAQNWQPKGGGLKFGAHHTLLQTIPLATLQGTLKFTDQQGEPVNVTGKAWGSHSRSQLGPHEQNLWSSKIRAIDLKQDRTLYLRTLKTTPDFGAKQLSYIILTQGDRLVFQGTSFDLNVSESFVDKKMHDYKVPLQFTIDASDAQQPSRRLKGQFKVSKRTRRRNPIAKRSWAERMIIERFAKPMEYRYTLRYDLSLSGSSKGTYQGEATYEVYHFNQE